MNTPATQPLDFSEYIAAIKRRRGLITWVGLPVLIFSVGLAIGLPDIYRSTAFIKFSEAEVSGALQQQQGSPEKVYEDQYVESLADAVLDRQNLKGILGKVTITDNQAEEPGAALAKIEAHTSVSTVRAQVLDPNSGREREVISAFTVSFESRDPKVAQQGAAWLADAFLRASRGILKERAAAAAAFYAAEANRFRQEIGGLEERLAAFKAKNFGRLPELADANLNALDRTERDLENVDMQIRNLNQDRIFILQQIETARAQGPDVTLLKQLEAEYTQKSAIYDENHPDVLSLRRRIDSVKSGGPAASNQSLPEQLAAQRAVLESARQRYSDDHPDVKRIMRNIETLEARIARGERADSGDLTSPVISQLQTQLRAMDTQLAALQLRSVQLRGKLSEFESRIETTPMVEREYQTLTRDMELARKKYDDLLSRQLDAQLKEAAIASGRSDELKLVQPPPLPAKPAKPMRIAILLLGLVLAAGLALGAMVVAEGVDQNVRGSRDVRRILAVSPLAVIPTIPDPATRREFGRKAAALAGGVAVGTALLVLVIRMSTA